VDPRNSDKRQAGGPADLVCLAALGACRRSDPPTPPSPPPPAVTVAQARPARVPVTLELPGRVNPVRVAQVRARVDGVVLRRGFREGGDVQAGQRLFKIDPAPYVTDLLPTCRRRRHALSPDCSLVGKAGARNQAVRKRRRPANFS
jgi:multidrug efflux pump subunit AcrA (membrane-fusion protein)